MWLYNFLKRAAHDHCSRVTFGEYGLNDLTMAATVLVVLVAVVYDAFVCIF